MKTIFGFAVPNWAVALMHRWPGHVSTQGCDAHRIEFCLLSYTRATPSASKTNATVAMASCSSIETVARQKAARKKQRVYIYNVCAKCGRGSCAMLDAPTFYRHQHADGGWDSPAFGCAQCPWTTHWVSFRKHSESLTDVHSVSARDASTLVTAGMLVLSLFTKCISEMVEVIHVTTNLVWCHENCRCFFYS